MADPNSVSKEDIAVRGLVDVAFVDRAIEAGALTGSTDTGLAAEDATRIRFLDAWDSAGMSVEALGSLVRGGEISFSFLQVPWLQTPPRLGRTYDDLARDTGVDLGALQAIHEALGLAPPQGADQIREDDLVLVDWLASFVESGAEQQAVLRLLHVYSGLLRRMAVAEAEMYETEIEGRLRDSGLSEKDLLATGGDVGTRMAGLFEETLLAIYRRHRQQVWLDHSIGHVEILLESKGLYERLERPPCVCFIDLTGYTRLTEDRGDRAAADIAEALASLIERTSRAYDGRPVRWLGDGGMFVFRSAHAATRAALEVAQRAADCGLPATHTGIHCGPVIFQDGDIFGRTVNIASRLSAAAAEGEVLVSDSAAQQLGGDTTLEDLGRIELKGLPEPLQVFRVIP